jgi:anti-sigma-K factor RskA
MIDLHETAGLYAVDALDPAELDEYESHLASCPACQDEVAEFCETAAELSLLALATPRPALRGSVLHAVRSTPQLSGMNPALRAVPATDEYRPAAEDQRLTAPSGLGGASPDSVVPEAAEERSDAPVDQLALRRRLRRSRVLSGLVAAMVALAVGLGGVVFTLVQNRQAQVAQITLERQLYSAPDAVTTTSALPSGGRATFVASRQLNRAMFLGTDLPDPGQNRYQLWTVTGTDLNKPTGVYRDRQVADTDSEIKVFFSGDVAGADFLAVNVEPAGSTDQAPTSPVLAVGPTTT